MTVYINESSFPKNKLTNNVIKIRFDANIKPVLTHWRDGFKVIYILIVYCFYGRRTAVSLVLGNVDNGVYSALSIFSPFNIIGRRE